MFCISLAIYPGLRSAIYSFCPRRIWRAFHIHAAALDCCTVSMTVNCHTVAITLLVYVKSTTVTTCTFGIDCDGARCALIIYI